MPVDFQNDIRFQNRPEARIDEYEFTGGLFTDAHETKLKTNESPNLQNVVFNDTGSIKTRNGYLRYNTDPVGASSDEANTGASTGTTVLDDYTDYAAQTFQVGTQASITQVDLYLEMQTSGQEQLVQAQLWSGSTGPSELLAKSQILLVSGTSETEYSFRFREPYTLSASTEYAIVLVPYTQGSSTTINAVEVHYTGSAYANGAAYTSTDSGSSWSAVSSTDYKFNVYTGGNTGGSGLFRFYGDSGIQQLIAKIGTSLYRGNDVSGAMTAITLGSGVSLASASFIDWTVSNGTLLLVDGTNKIQKYRGSTNANYTTGTISCTNGDATVTGSGTSWNTSTNAEVGEYIQMPDGKWYKIASIASDTSLEIEIAYPGTTQSGQSYTISPWGEVQGRLDATAPASLVRPTPNYIENHINRIWTLDGNTLRFSVLDTSVSGEHFNDFDTSNNSGAIIIPSGKGDSGTGLYSLNNTLYVFQRRSIWRVYGTSPANFELRNVSQEIGMIDFRTLIEWNGTLMFLSEQGVVRFDGTNYDIVSANRINTDIDAWANNTSPAAVLWDNKYVLSYTPSGESQNSEAIFYDLVRGVWGKFTGLHAARWSAWNGGTDSGQIYFISSNQGSIYQWDTGGHDDGYEIETIYDTPSIGFDKNTHQKLAKKLYVQQLALGDWNMTVTAYSDTVAGTTNTINLTPGTASLWDVAVWDTDSWSGETSILNERAAQFEGDAYYFKVRLYQSGYNEGIEVLGVTIVTRPRRLI